MRACLVFLQSLLQASFWLFPRSASLWQRFPRYWHCGPSSSRSQWPLQLRHSISLLPARVRIRAQASYYSVAAPDLKRKVPRASKTAARWRRHCAFFVNRIIQRFSGFKKNFSQIRANGSQQKCGRPCHYHKMWTAFRASGRWTDSQPLNRRLISFLQRTDSSWR